MLRKDQVMFTYLHLAADLNQTRALLKSGCTAIAYETVTDPQGRLPLADADVGSCGTHGPHGWRLLHCRMCAAAADVLLSRRAGRSAGQGGHFRRRDVGSNAAVIAVGMGGDVAIIDRSVPRLAELDRQFAGRVRTIYATVGCDRGTGANRRSGDRCGADPGCGGAQMVTREMVGSHEERCGYCGRRDRSGRLRGNRAADHPRRTRLIRSMASCIIASPICRAPLRALRPSRSTTPHCLIYWRWRIKAGARRWRTTCISGRGLNIAEGQITNQAVAEALREILHGAGKFVACRLRLSCGAQRRKMPKALSARTAKPFAVELHRIIHLMKSPTGHAP